MGDDLLYDRMHLHLRRSRVMGVNRIELTGFTDTMRERLPSRRGRGRSLQTAAHVTPIYLAKFSLCSCAYCWRDLCWSPFVVSSASSRMPAVLRPVRQARLVQ